MLRIFKPHSKNNIQNNFDFESAKRLHLYHHKNEAKRENQREMTIKKEGFRRDKTRFLNTNDVISRY